MIAYAKWEDDFIFFKPTIVSCEELSFHYLKPVEFLFALNINRHYLYSIYVVIFTDHKSVQHVLTQEDQNLHKRR